MIIDCVTNTDNFLTSGYNYHAYIKRSNNSEQEKAQVLEYMISFCKNTYEPKNYLMLWLTIYKDIFKKEYEEGYDYLVAFKNKSDMILFKIGMS